MLVIDRDEKFEQFDAIYFKNTLHSAYTLFLTSFNTVKPILVSLPF